MDQSFRVLQYHLVIQQGAAYQLTWSDISGHNSYATQKKRTGKENKTIKKTNIKKILKKI